ncbi:hypothetical protein, partial [Streptomyces sp. E5N91]|uniref:hypothetical protein n=1 Tax=Streptomyces sp. E5N91 TaxID=1851996 RepID=UPI001EE975BE
LRERSLTFIASLCVQTTDGWTEVGRATGLTTATAQLSRSDGLPMAIGECYLARVQASVPSYTSDWALSSTVTILDAVPVTAEYTAGSLIAQWPTSAVPGAAGYQAIISPPAGQAATHFVPAAAGPQVQAEFDLTGMPRGGTYGLVIQVLAPDGTIGPGSQASVPVADPPRLLSVTWQQAALWEAQWEVACGATGYQLVITDADGRPLREVGTGSELSCEFQVTVLPHEVPLAAHVATVMGSWTSEPSAPKIFVLVDPPTDLTVVADDVAVTVNWTFVTAASGYSVLFSSTEASLPLSTDTPPPMRVPYSKLKRGVTYHVAVKPWSGGPWSEPVSVTVPERPPGA